MSSRNQKFVIHFVLLLLADYALAKEAPLLAALLPNIYQEYFQLTSNENQYHLVINLPDGSKRDEVVELKNPGSPEQYLAVMGTSNTYYPELQATLTYSADKNGYVVKYQYAPPAPPTYQPMHLSPLSLKSAAG